MKSLAEAHWRDSARSIRFFFLDGKAAFVFLFVLIYPRWWTLIAAFVLMLFFTLLNRYGFTLSVFGRMLRSFFAGRRKVVVSWWMR